MGPRALLGENKGIQIHPNFQWLFYFNIWSVRDVSVQLNRGTLIAVEGVSQLLFCYVHQPILSLYYRNSVYSLILLYRVLEQFMSYLRHIQRRCIWFQTVYISIKPIQCASVCGG